MARTKRTKKYYKKSRWSSNIQQLADTNIAAPATVGYFSGTTTLATNPAQTNLGVSQIYTVKNFETSFTIETRSSTTYIESITAFIMFVPQGMNIDESYPIQHPEYIMNYKFLGSPLENARPDSQAAPYRLKTRLSRKLNTGDSVVLFIRAYNTNESAVNLRLNGLVRWWTKAN